MLSDRRDAFSSLRLLFLAVALVGSSARAQTPPAPGTPAMQALTLDQALAFAREHQPDLFAARARTNAAHADAQIPRGQWLPQLGVTAQLLGSTENNSSAAYLNVAPVAIPRIGATPGDEKQEWRPYASTIAAGSIRQEVFDFGRIEAQAEAADAALAAQKEKESAVSGDVDLSVANAFYLVLASHDIVAAAERAGANASLANDEATQAVRVGLRAQIDLVRANAELAHAQVGVERAKGSLLVAQGNLAAAIGSPDPLIDATGTPIPSLTLPAMQQAVAAALDRDPDVRAALATSQASLANTRAIRAELRPDLFASASLTARAGGAALSSGAEANGNGFLPNVPNWDVGLVLSWNIFDGVTWARASAASAREQVASADLSALRQRIVASVQQAWTTAKSTQDTLPALQKAAEAARANEQQAAARFKSGLGTSLDLADAEQILVQAEVELAAGRFDYARARAQLSRLTWENRP